MSFAERARKRVNTYMDNLKAAQVRREQEAEAKAILKMERAKSALEREKIRSGLALEREQIRADIAREKLRLQKEMYDAKAATRSAKSALQKARRAAGDVGIGEKIAAGIAKLQAPKKGKPAPRRRKPQAAVARKKSTGSDINRILWG